MNTDELTQIIETEVPPTAKQYAEDLFSWLSEHVNEGMDERIAEWLEENFREEGAEFVDDDLETIAKDLIQPAFMSIALWKLSGEMAESAKGWSHVLWTNMREKYQSE